VPAYSAINAAILGGRVAFHGQDVSARIILHDFLANLFHLLAGGGLQSVIVVERDHVQNHVLRDGMGRADEDSLQQVHSSPCSQITGIRGLVSIASTTFGTIAALRPRAAAD
jgi:hypothetical protein